DQLRGVGHGGDALRVRVQDAAHRLLAHIGDHDLGALRAQVVHQVVADLADPGDTDLAVPQRGVAPQVLGGGPHALVDAEGREYGGVARAAVLGGPAGRPAALPRDDVHVRDVRADVARGHVPAAEGGHEAAVGEGQFLALDQLRGADDHGLATAVFEACDGVLVRLAAREVQCVGDGLFRGGERVETRAA